MADLKLFTQERIDQISAGYDLDGGGYAFEEIEIGGTTELQWTDPDPDYVPWIFGSQGSPGWRDYYGLSCPVYVFAVEDCTKDWPSHGWTDTDGERYLLRCSGVLQGTDRECWCEGKEPECKRCEDGVVDSPGGSWALYSLETEDEITDKILRHIADKLAAARLSSDATVRDMVDVLWPGVTGAMLSAYTRDNVDEIRDLLRAHEESGS